MTTSIQKLFIAITLLVAISSTTSCKKDTFDEPPGNTVDPNLDTISISRLKAYYTGGSPVSIPDDVTIAGIVIGDDRTGNLYKSIVIDDGNAAIALSIDVSSGLYTDYPVGRKIYVKCKGLALGTYGGTPQLGGYVDGASVGRIAQALLPKIIVKGPIGNDITPLIQHVHIAQLNDAYLSRLIQLDTVEFKTTSADTAYADVYKPIPDDGNRILGDCDGGTITVRTSPYCTFAYVKTPTGNGTVLGIYTKYNSTKQFTIRDTSDVNLRGTNCSAIPVPVVDTLLFQNFNSFSTGNLNIPSWTNFAVTGNELYQISGTSDFYAKITAFGSGKSSVVSWLVTPKVNLNSTTNEILTFKTAAGFLKAGTLFEVFISNDFSGDPTTATWTPLSATIATAPASGYSSFTSSGNVSLSSFSGDVVIGFKYTGADPSGTASDLTTTYEVDNVFIKGTH
ncbi:MAG: DUF5689 domain-containing protein [Chitinophagales bacterium]